jgi:hypothetical protein
MEPCEVPSFAPAARSQCGCAAAHEPLPVHVRHVAFATAPPERTTYHVEYPISLAAPRSLDVVDEIHGMTSVLFVLIPIVAVWVAARQRRRSGILVLGLSSPFSSSPLETVFEERKNVVATAILACGTS